MMKSLSLLLLLAVSLPQSFASHYFPDGDPIQRLGIFAFEPVVLSPGQDSYLVADDYFIISTEINEIQKSNNELPYMPLPAVIKELSASRYWISTIDEDGRLRIYERSIWHPPVLVDSEKQWPIVENYQTISKQIIPEFGASKFQIREADICYKQNDKLNCVGARRDTYRSENTKIVDFAIHPAWYYNSLCTVEEDFNAARSVGCSDLHPVYRQPDWQSMISLSNFKQPYKLAIGETDFNSHFHTLCVLDESGAICSNRSPSDSDQIAPIRVKNAKGAIDIVVGSGLGCARMPNSSALCWQAYDYRWHRLKDLQNAPLNEFTIPNVQSMFADGHLICFTDDKPDVKCLVPATESTPSDRKIKSSKWAYKVMLRTSNWFLELSKISPAYRQEWFEKVGEAFNRILRNEKEARLREELHYLSLQLTDPVLKSVTSSYYKARVEQKLERYVSQVQARLKLSDPRQSKHFFDSPVNRDFTLRLIATTLETVQPLIIDREFGSEIKSIRNKVESAILAEGNAQVKLIKEVTSNHVFWDRLHEILARSQKLIAFGEVFEKAILWLNEIK